MTTKQKRVRLTTFCDNHDCCEECPLCAPVCRCGCMTNFLMIKNGKYDMADGEIDKAYAIAFPDPDHDPAPSTEETEGGKVLTEEDILDASAAVMEDEETGTFGLIKANPLFALLLGVYTTELCKKLFPESGEDDG